MPSLRNCAALCVAAAFSPFLAAQAQDIFITNQNVSFGVEFNATPRVFTGTQDFFMADPVGDPAGVMFKTAWAYRLDNDTQEFIFNDGAGQVMFQNTGPVGTATWADVDMRGKIAATAIYTALPTGTNSGVVVVRMVITNISTQPVTLNLYHMSDIDLCGASYLNNVVTPGSDGRQAVTSTSCSETAEQYAACADRWEVGSYTNVGGSSAQGYVDLYTKLENTSIDILRNDTAPFGPYDIRGAFQWQDRVLQPGQTENFTLAFGHNDRACPYAFTRFGTGIGGAAGVPVLSTNGDAILGQSFSPSISNAAPNTLGIMVFGFFRGTNSFGDLNVYVGNPSSSILAPIDGMGNGSITFTLPNVPSLCGTKLHGQGFVFGDTSSTSTTNLPVTHTTAGCWVVGVY